MARTKGAAEDVGVMVVAMGFGVLCFTVVLVINTVMQPDSSKAFYGAGFAGVFGAYGFLLRGWLDGKA